eukprot:gene11668-14881_t
MEKRLRSWTLPTSSLPSGTDGTSSTDAPSANGDSSNGGDGSQSKPLTREVRSDTSISCRSDPGSQFSSKTPSLSSPALDQMKTPVLSLAHPDNTSRPPTVRRNSGTGVVSSKPTVVTPATPSAPPTPGRAAK